MDKETLSNYGWIVICVLVLAVMIALAGPFGTFVANAVKSTTQGLFDVNQNALDAAGIEIDDNEFPACVHTYENCICTQCGAILEHTCNYENRKCTLCGDELPEIITFTIMSQEYQFEEGMTWEQWVDSEYNTGYRNVLYTKSNGQVKIYIADNGTYYVSLNRVKVSLTDTIVYGKYDTIN